MDYRKVGDYFFALITKEFNLNDEKIINKQNYIKSHKDLQVKITTFLEEIINSSSQFKREVILDYLLELYVNNNEGSISDYIISKSQKELYSFASDNVYFLEALIQNYINKLIENDYQLKSAKKEEKSEIIAVKSLPDVLREDFLCIYNFLIQRAMPLDTFGEFMYNYFTVGGKVTTDSKDFMESIKRLSEYKDIFIRLMFADLYIALSNENDDHEFDVYLEHINKCIESNDYRLPFDFGLGVDMFMLLAGAISDEEIRIDNVLDSKIETYETYKKINFLYPIEDIKHKRG